MKMKECKQRGISVGFIDPYIVNEVMLHHYPVDVEGDLLLSPDFGQIRRWAVIEMGLEDMHMKSQRSGLVQEFGLDCPCIFKL